MNTAFPKTRIILNESPQIIIFGHWDFASSEVFEQLQQDFAFSRDEVVQSKASYVEGEISVTM